MRVLSWGKFIKDAGTHVGVAVDFGSLDVQFNLEDEGEIKRRKN